MLGSIASLSLEHQLLLLVIGVVAFGLESLWRNFFTPKSPAELVRELDKSDEPRDHQVLCEILDEDPTAWNAAPAEPWDVAADLRALARPLTSFLGSVRQLACAAARFARFGRNRTSEPVPEPVKA
ncbi:MAG: hypothetical protein KDD66_00660 [Bdellovibrionales bacterium]|nr:hypothetical protein [Bdellovibrionales bacterium]